MGIGLLPLRILGVRAGKLPGTRQSYASRTADTATRPAMP